jgi:formate dehydrogenase major subunit
MAEDKEFPYTLMIGPSLFHCGTLSAHAEGPVILAPESCLNMNPDEMIHLDLSPGDLVQVTSRQGSVQVTVRGNSDLAPGTLFLPLHFKEVRANLLTADSSIVPVKLERC